MGVVAAIELLDDGEYYACNMIERCLEYICSLELI